MATAERENPQIFGHPTGLFTLFFAEMWERFSYYGMRALLVFYMIKGFLGMNDSDAFAVYGAYTALVYMTPYFGGMLADKLLGRRRAVVLGGVLMATGHLLMTIEEKNMFFIALAFLIVGNGFFKPNISTIVGELYPRTSEKKDAGFTIFYMGINLGAAMSPIVCGYVGETYGWHYGFGLATAGMMVGIAVFTMPTRLTQLIIGGGSVATSISMLFLQDNLLQLLVRIFMAVMLVVAGVVAVRALNKGPLPEWAGAPPSKEALKKKVAGVIPAEWAVYLASVVAVLAFAYIVQNQQLAAVVLNIVGFYAFGYLLYEAVFKSKKVERERLLVIIVLAVFHTCFWAFFEQAGTSLNNWTDRNIDRVTEEKSLAEGDVGTTLEFRVPLKTSDPELSKLPALTQEQLGYTNDDPALKELVIQAIANVEEGRNAKRADSDKVKPEDITKLGTTLKAQPRFTMTSLSYLRSAAGYDPGDAKSVEAAKPFQKVTWKVASDNVGMGLASSEVPASEFQAANPIYILLFGLVFSALWTFLGRRGRDPSAPVKFSLGLFQLGLGFLVFWYGTTMASPRGMSAMHYLLLGYMLLTTGELCLSPVGLSMVTKLAPKRLVSTVMGVWFVSITYANYVAAIIATLTVPQEGKSKIQALTDAVVNIFTGGGHGGGGLQVIPPPQDTIKTYGEVFLVIGQIAIGAAVVCFALKWTLNKWMHVDVDDEAEEDGTPAKADAEPEPA
jgi:proton-dependent oligopeptide transporter, POT family